MAQLHDQLLANMHEWLWNEHPETRYMYHANFNNLPLALESMLPVSVKMRLMSVIKHIGAVNGVMDAEFYWAGRMYAFDAKVGADRLSKEQLAFGAALLAQGGAFCEIRSLEQFKAEVECVLDNGCLINEMI